MGTPRDITHRRRFAQVVQEIEGIKLTCPDCKVSLIKEKIDCIGIGDVASLPMMHCPQCKMYYICWRQEDE